MTDELGVAVSVGAWIGASIVIGAWAARWSPERLERAGRLVRLRSWEHDGRFWQRRLKAMTWKRWLPDAGRFGGGRTKSEFFRGRAAELAGFRLETIRAELVHWLIAATGPVHALWCRAEVAAAMVVLGVAWNAPFIVVQRMNRGRVERILRRRA